MSASHVPRACGMVQTFTVPLGRWVAPCPTTSLFDLQHRFGLMPLTDDVEEAPVQLSLPVIVRL